MPINVYGDNLIDPFTFDISPQMTATGITFNSASGYSSPVTVNYSFALNASTGNQTLTLSNRFGTSNAVNFFVYDPPVSVSSITPSTWQAGASNFSVTILGTGFGTNPTVSVSDPNATCSVTSASDNGTYAQISCNCSVNGSDSGSNPMVTVTSRGYGGSAFAPGSAGQPDNAGENVTIAGGGEGLRPISPALTHRRESSAARSTR